MKWNQFRLTTTTEAEDIVSSMLMDLGIEGVQIEDKVPLTKQDKEQMFVDILPEFPEDDGTAYLTFYLEEDVDSSELILKIKKELEEMRSYINVGACIIEESQTEDVDWVNNWKQYFHQFYIDDILVIPSWERVKEEDNDKMIIHIDPGTAFGTGMHETTQLCIRALRKYVTPQTEILDVGCGSGILGMLALKFGAKHSVGTDLDPCAIEATHENMEENGISRDRYEVMIGNIIDDKEIQDKVGYEKYDIVVANILADVLLPLTPVILRQMKPGAVYIISGIIDDKEETVAKAVKAAGLAILEINRQGEWVSITARDNDRNRRTKMQHFFVTPEQVKKDVIYVEGSDVNHMRNVLRMRPGEELSVSDGNNRRYICRIKGYEETQAALEILEEKLADTELSSRIYLFQGIPKQEKMELIVQKCVELGVYAIVPVIMKRCVVKLDEKKASQKIERWNKIAESASKQAGRSRIPEVLPVLTFAEALDMAKELDVCLLPYELASDMQETKRIITSVRPGQSVGIFIGPEGGFEKEEAELAIFRGAREITLGKRILRTETAGLAIVSVLMFHLEG